MTDVPATPRGSSSTPPSAEAVGPLRLALWFGLAGGLAEAALYLTQRFALHRYVRLNPQLVWMAPVSEACLLAVPGVMLWVYARRRPPERWWQAAVSLCAAVAAFGNLLLASQVHEWARLVLAAGLGVAVGRWASAHRPLASRIVRRTLPALAGTVALAFAAMNGVPALRERRALAALPSARADAPNVLLLILDTVRALDLSLYGYARPTTPTLAKWGERGVVFDRAIAGASWTLPSHAVIFTGIDAHRLTVDWRTPLDEQNQTLAEAMRDRGYLTAGFAANVVYASRSSGLGRGFLHYVDYPVTWSAVLVNGQVIRRLVGTDWLRRLLGLHDLSERESAERMRQRAVNWLSAHRERPYFAFVNLYDAHNPYLPPPPFDTLFAGHLSWSQRNLWLETPQPVSPAQAQPERDVYDGAIAYLDQQIGLMLQDLETRGLLRNTLIIVTADHGEEFGEHGLLDHGNSLYLPSLHVPLLMVWPGHIPASRRVHSPVSLRDIAATTLELVGPGSRFAGRSLRPLWADPAADTVTAPALAEVRRTANQRAWFPASMGGLSSGVTGSDQLIRASWGAELHYDLRTDLFGTRLSADAAEAARLRALVPAPPR